jgi:SAM-dependent methyltransferase
VSDRDETTDSPEDFPEFLHALRTRELRRLPPGAKVVLSGGAAGTWYLDWLESNYPTPIVRHIAVEALAPKPDELPGHVEWISSTLGDLGAVESDSVDLVFAGEVIEHLWPDDIAGFLAEARRVLRPGGHIALDSPNRRVTQPLRWLHPEHTVEFAVDEIVELLERAGFEDIEVRGVLLGYDAESHQFLPVERLDAIVGREERVARAPDRPEDAFVWWAEATRGERQADLAGLQARTRELFSHFRRHRLAQLQASVGRVEDSPHDVRFVHAVPGEIGVMLHGPYLPMPAGTWEAVFELSARDAGSRPPDEEVGWLDVTHGDPPVVLGRLELTAGDFPADGWLRQAVGFEAVETTMGVEFRVHSRGRVNLAARAYVDLRPTTNPPLPRRRAERRVRAWVIRHRRVKAVAKVIRSLLPRRWRKRFERAGGAG